MSLIFVAPQPDSPNIAHAGGQLTATTGFAGFAADHGLLVRWVDTAQSNFPVPAARIRILRAARRLIRFTRGIAASDCRGAILFSGGGASFLERSLMALIARLAGKAVVLMIRSGHFQTQFRRSAAFRLAARLLLRIPNRIGIQGPSWLTVLRDAGVPRERIVIVPNWLSHAATAPRVRRRQPDSSLRLLFAGWMTRHKGIPELVAAARSLAAEGADFTLTMVGGGDLLDQMREAATEPALARHLVVTGWLSREALAEEMTRADILVLPSHAEGFPNVIMEALAEGLAVIATAVGAIPDSIVDGVNGRIVPVRDPAAIAEAVRGYLSDPTRLEAHSRAALATAAKLHGRDANCRALLAALARSPHDFDLLGR